MIKQNKYFLKVKKKLFGIQGNDGSLYKFAIYFMLIVLGFVFLYPIFYMLMTSLKSNIDLADSSVQWVPTSLYLENYKIIVAALDVPSSYFRTFVVAGLGTVAVVISSTLTGYGLARFNFKGKYVIIMVMILSFVIPKTLFYVPNFFLYDFLGLRFSLRVITIPALFGQGLMSSFFILIFYQFFSMIPKQLEEAALIDGANNWTIFYKIALPMAGPAFVITIIYCFSIYWNETTVVKNFLDNNPFQKTTPVLMNLLESNYGAFEGQIADEANRAFTESKAFAASLINMAPLTIFYLIVQRWFVESIDNTGITGE